jgi:hypothetical protein
VSSLLQRCQSESREQLSDADLADSMRAESFHLMDAHPIAAAHLVLAAASIAPTCPAEQDVADQFCYVIADFAQQLGLLHRRAVERNTREGTSRAAKH